MFGRMDVSMKYNPDIHHRRSIRLQHFDYSQAGALFVTICTYNRENLFGGIAAGLMRLNDAGRMAGKCWNDIPSHFPNVELDGFVIMPNHVHGIIVIIDADANVAANNLSEILAKNQSTLREKNISPLQCPETTIHSIGTSGTIGSIVRGFKIGVTKWFRQQTDIHQVWQRNYWEHVIRNETEREQIREYMRTNPVRWEQDRLNPAVNPDMDNP